jgi:putative transcriptional regulator
MDMKQLRERINKRPEQIAVDLEVTLSTVRNWESGRHEPRLPISEIPKFLAVYECTLEEAIDAAKASTQKHKASQ